MHRGDIATGQIDGKRCDACHFRGRIKGSGGDIWQRDNGTVGIAATIYTADGTGRINDFPIKRHIAIAGTGRLCRKKRCADSHSKER
ncbi:hypothetical protein D3C86_2019140 [compost metagenome]